MGVRDGQIVSPSREMCGFLTGIMSRLRDERMPRGVEFVAMNQKRLPVLGGLKHEERSARMGRRFVRSVLCYRRHLPRNSGQLRRFAQTRREFFPNGALERQWPRSTAFCVTESACDCRQIVGQRRRLIRCRKDVHMTPHALQIVRLRVCALMPGLDTGLRTTMITDEPDAQPAFWLVAAPDTAGSPTSTHPFGLGQVFAAGGRSKMACR